MKTLRDIFFGKGTFTNGLIAVTILGLIVLGCTCNGEDFDFDKKSNTNSSEKKTKEDGNPFETPKDKKDDDFEKADASKREVPSDEELNKMVKEDILAFDQALEDKDFSDFYKRISEFWQDQTSPRKLKKGFQSFIDGNADLSGVKDLDAKFESRPTVESKRRGGLKIMEVNGTFDTEPNESTFELKYIPEGKEWKLMGFFVRTTVYKKK